MKQATKVYYLKESVRIHDPKRFSVQASQVLEKISVLLLHATSLLKRSCAQGMPLIVVLRELTAIDGHH